MGGNDGFAQFDSASITTASGSEKTFSIGKTQFRRRDLIFGGLAILALIGVIILAIVLAVEVSSDDDSDEAVHSSALTSSYCQTQACHKTAYLTNQNLNITADPCQDFYAYSCGGFPAAHPRSPNLQYVTAAGMVYWENMAKLQRALEEQEQVADPDYVKNMKKFFETCNGHFDKMELRGTPFLEHIVDKMPGWDLFGEFDPSTFDLQAATEQVQVDFFTGAFYSLIVAKNLEDWSKTILEVTPGSYGLPHSWHFFLYTDQFTAWQSGRYIKYIRDVAHLIRFDNGLSYDEELVANFSSDVFDVEHDLAWETHLYLLPLEDSNDRHRDEKTRTLDEVTADLNNTVDFTKLMQAMFMEHRSQITGQTKIALAHEEFFISLGRLLSHYLTTDVGKRKLHNYLSWKLLNRYVQDLSWEYLHEFRQFAYIASGSKDQSNLYSSCLNDLDYVMSDGLNAMFTRHYTDTERRTQANDVVNDIKLEMADTIDSFTWMTDPEKQLAKDKVMNIIQKVGYSDTWKDDQAMDDMYSGLDIKSGDHFSNVLSLNEVKRKYLGKFVANAAPSNRWRLDVWHPSVNFDDEGPEIMVPYAAFESPIFLLNGPAFYNYGGLGSHVGTRLMHALDRVGREYRHDKHFKEDWWSSDTLTQYDQILNCTVRSMMHIPFGEAQDSQDYTGNTNATDTLRRYSVSLTDAISGARLSYKAYMKFRRFEQMPLITPGQDPAKLFFLGFAQFFCENIPEYPHDGTLTPTAASALIEKEWVNLIVSQMPEFRQAYQCPATSRLAKEVACLLFP